MPGKAVAASLLLVVGVILTACSPSEADRSAQVTAIAGGIYATQTAAVSAPAPSPAPLARPPVTPTARPAIAPTAFASPSSPVRPPLTSGALPDNAARELDAAIRNEYTTPDSFTARSLRMMSQMKGAGTGYLEVESTDQYLPFPAREDEQPTLLPVSPSHLKVRGRGDGTEISILNYEEFVLLVQSATGLGDVVIPAGVYLVRAGGSWVLAAQPPAAMAAPATPLPIPPTAQPTAEPTAYPDPLSGEVRASAEQAFASGRMVYLYDPQPNSVSRSNLDATEFSLRYILSKDAREAPNIVFLRKVNAEGAGEYIVPAIKRMGLGDQTVSLKDWTSQTGTLTFTPSSNSMIDPSDQPGGDPNLALLTAWIVTFNGITPLYGPPNPHVADPVYLDVLLLAPEVRDAAQSSPDASKLPYDKVMLLSDATRQLSNTVRIPIAP